MSIYTIHNALAELLQEIPESGEMTDEQVEQYEALGLELAEKQENTLFYYRNLELDAEALDSEIKRLSAMKQALNRKKEGIIKLIEYGMDKLELNEIKFATIKATRKLNPPKVVIQDGVDLPEQYLRTKTIIEPDKTALKDALQNGEVIEGVRIQQDTRIEIK